MESMLDKQKLQKLLEMLDRLIRDEREQLMLLDTMGGFDIQRPQGDMLRHTMQQKLEKLNALREQLIRMLDAYTRYDEACDLSFSESGTESDASGFTFTDTSLSADVWDDFGLWDDCAPEMYPPKPAAPELTMSQVEFSAISAKSVRPDDYAMIDVVMYEPAFRSVVDELLAQADEPMQEKRSGVIAVNTGARVQVLLSSPDVPIDEPMEEGTWEGKYLQFSFAVSIPADLKKRRVLFIATVYINGIIATHLRFLADCAPGKRASAVERRDITSAFVSYASQDRSRVAAVVQGMKKARPDLDIFFDVESLRSGQDWSTALSREIERRDILYLCWSHFARESSWVNREWRYALSLKGLEGIEPIPIEPPSQCPPPEELAQKHFNDMILYVIRASEEE